MSDPGLQKMEQPSLALDLDVFDFGGIFVVVLFQHAAGHLNDAPHFKLRSRELLPATREGGKRTDSKSDRANPRQAKHCLGR